MACYGNSLFVFLSKAMMTCSEQKNTHKWCNNFKDLTLELPLKPETSGKNPSNLHLLPGINGLFGLLLTSAMVWGDDLLKTPREMYRSKNINWFELSCLEFEHILSEWLLYNSNFLTLTCSLICHFHHHWLPSWKISEIRMMLVNYHILSDGRAWRVLMLVIWESRNRTNRTKCPDSGKPVRFLMPIWLFHGNFLVTWAKLKH